MKILLVTDPMVSLIQPYQGGTEAFTVELAQALVHQGHVVDIVASKGDELMPFQVKEFEESPYSMRDDIHSEYEGQQTYKLLQYGMVDISSYDIVHYHSFNPTIYEMGSLHSNPSIVTLHIPPNDELTVALQLFNKRSRPTFVAISERMRQVWEPLLPGALIVKIVNGINIDQWPLVQHDQDGYLLWTGRINKEKNPLDAIKISEETGIPLKIVGNIANTDYFEQKISPRLSDTIEYIGHVTQQQLRDVIAGARVYVATAVWQEPFGLSILEMLASGLPVVGYESAIAPELQQKPYVHVIPTQDPTLLSTVLAKTPSIKPSGCRSFAMTMTMDNCAAHYDTLYKETKIKVHHE